ncbi:MAG: hypothetical protein ABEJ08_03615 [Halobacteriaceae archaeon]
MTWTRYTCDGCGAELDNRKDLDRVDGTVTRTWRCRYCGTEVPGVVAEKLDHQKQGDVPDR